MTFLLSSVNFWLNWESIFLILSTSLSILPYAALIALNMILKILTFELLTKQDILTPFAFSTTSPHRSIFSIPKWRFRLKIWTWFMAHEKSNMTNLVLLFLDFINCLFVLFESSLLLHNSFLQTKKLLSYLKWATRNSATCDKSKWLTFWLELDTCSTRLLIRPWCARISSAVDSVLVDFPFLEFLCVNA